MSITVYAIHAPDADKLTGVIAEMRSMGAPMIEVVDCGDHYMALEGSHRLAAAHALGLTPSMVIREQQDDLDLTRFDWFQAQNSAGEVAGELFSSAQAVAYTFGEG